MRLEEDRKKRWQIGGFLPRLSLMSVGAFKVQSILYSIVAVGVCTGWAQGVSTNAAPTNAAPNVITFTGTNTTPVVEGTVTNKVETPPPPIVEGATNETTNLKPMAPKPDNTTKLGAFSVIPDRNPFRLVKPEEEKVEEVEEPAAPVIGIPQLKGISRVPGNVRALLRVSPIGGGAHKYHFVGENERVEGVTVLKIEADKGAVELEVKGSTYTRVLDSFKEVAGVINEVGPSGDKFRPTGGTQAVKPSKVGSGDSQSRPDPKLPKPGELKTVPQRRPSTSHLQPPPASDLFELPAFNESVQQKIIDPEMIYTQREIIRGQLAPGTPSDFRR